MSGDVIGWMGRRLDQGVHDRAALRAVEAERDALAEVAHQGNEREKALEARVEALREALEEIKSPRCGFFRAADGVMSIDMGEPARIATEALSGDDEARG